MWLSVIDTPKVEYVSTLGEVQTIVVLFIICAIISMWPNLHLTSEDVPDIITTKNAERVLPVITPK